MVEASNTPTGLRRCLYIEASPRQENSASTAAAGAFLDALQSHAQSVAVDTLDLWSQSLPEFDGPAIDAKYAKLSGLALSRVQEVAWLRIQEVVDRLKSADAVVISTPMWNFGIPYKLKHWIDLVTQPGLTFSFDPLTGYSPLLSPRPTLVILASAGDYAGGPSRGRPDLASPYLEAALAFVGLGDLKLVRVGPTAGPVAEVAAAAMAAELSLVKLASSFMGGSQ